MLSFYIKNIIHPPHISWLPGLSCASLDTCDGQGGHIFQTYHYFIYLFGGPILAYEIMLPWHDGMTFLVSKVTYLTSSRQYPTAFALVQERAEASRIRRTHGKSMVRLGKTHIYLTDILPVCSSRSTRQLAYSSVVPAPLGRAARGSR